MAIERKDLMPPIHHHFLDGTKMNDSEFKEWCEANTIPRTCVIYDAIADMQRKRICGER